MLADHEVIHALLTYPSLARCAGGYCRPDRQQRPAGLDIGEASRRAGADGGHARGQHANNEHAGDGKRAAHGDCRRVPRHHLPTLHGSSPADGDRDPGCSDADEHGDRRANGAANARAYQGCHRQRDYSGDWYRSTDCDANPPTAHSDSHGHHADGADSAQQHGSATQPNADPGERPDRDSRTTTHPTDAAGARAALDVVGVRLGPAGLSLGDE